MADPAIGALAEFIEALQAVLKEIDRSNFELAWSKRSARTDFYANNVVKGIGNRLGLKLWKEFLSVDYVLFSEEAKRFRFFIESENDYWRVDKKKEELMKLCACRGDVAVLMTVVEWDESGPPGWKSQRHKCLPEWRLCVADHSGAIDSPMPVVVLVGELQGRRLRFYLESLTGPHADPLLDRAEQHVVYQRILGVDGAAYERGGPPNA